MQNTFLIQTILLFLITICLMLHATESKENHKTEEHKQFPSAIFNRVKRANNKPGFFRTLFSVIFEQWSDTKNTIGKVNTLINDNFLPENAPATTRSPPLTNSNISTTEAPFKITRTEFNKILRRNFKGLVRLFNIELKDALQQSNKNYAEYKRNATLEYSKFL